MQNLEGRVIETTPCKTYLVDCHLPSGTGFRASITLKDSVASMPIQFAHPLDPRIIEDADLEVSFAGRQIKVAVESNQMLKHILVPAAVDASLQQNFIAQVAYQEIVTKPFLDASLGDRSIEEVLNRDVSSSRPTRGVSIKVPLPQGFENFESELRTR
jgi:hypothetical protein